LEVFFEFIRLFSIVLILLLDDLKVLAKQLWVDVLFEDVTKHQRFFYFL
jgi:hypothetical protein